MVVVLGWEIHPVILLTTTVVYSPKGRSVIVTVPPKITPRLFGTEEDAATVEITSCAREVTDCNDSFKK
jgi:hypothetical protein